MRTRSKFVHSVMVGFVAAVGFLAACGGDDTSGRPPAGPDCKLTPAACIEGGTETGTDTGTDSAVKPDTATSDSGGGDAGRDSGGGDAATDASDAAPSDASDAG